MAKHTPDEFADKLISRLTAATADVERGVDRVTVAPTQKAAANIDKMKARLLQAFDSGKVERGLKRVSLEEWKAKMKEKGVPRIATGVQEARPKIVAFASKLLPFQDKLKQDIDKMPDVTLEHSVARATAWIRGMSKFTR